MRHMESIDDMEKNNLEYIISIIKKILTIVMLFSLVTGLFSCEKKPAYDKEWILGKTYSEIQEKYGEFDMKTAENDELASRGIYCSCAYVIKPKRVGYLGTTEAEYYMIYFKGGVAIRVDESYYIPGG